MVPDLLWDSIVDATTVFPFVGGVVAVECARLSEEGQMVRGRSETRWIGFGRGGNWGEEGGMISRLPNSCVGQEADYRFLIAMIGSRINAKVDHPSLCARGRRKRKRVTWANTKKMLLLMPTICRGKTLQFTIYLLHIQEENENNLSQPLFQ